MTRLWAERPRSYGSISGGGQVLQSAETGQTRIHWLQRALYLGCEADHSPSVEVKNGWSYTFAPPYAFMLCTGTALPDLCVSVGNSLFSVTA
jgi:hypothetical protein